MDEPVDPTENRKSSDRHRSAGSGGHTNVNWIIEEQQRCQQRDQPRKRRFFQRRTTPHRERASQREERKTGRQARRGRAAAPEHSRRHQHEADAGREAQGLADLQRGDFRVTERSQDLQDHGVPHHQQKIGIAFDPAFEGVIDESPPLVHVLRIDQRNRLVVDEEIQKGQRVKGENDDGGRRDPRGCPGGQAEAGHSADHIY